MLDGSALYASALAYPHKRIVRVSARTPSGTVLAEDVPVHTGSVSAQLQSRVTRTASFTLGPQWFPVADLDPFSPAHSIVTIEAGTEYPNGDRDLFPVFTGRVYSARLDADGQTVFRADDLAAEVTVADFEQPFPSQPGASTVAEIRRIVRLAYPTATFGPDDVDDAPVPKLTWDDDPGKALDDLATVAEARWYSLGNGSFVVRRLDYTGVGPSVSLHDGPGGTLVSADIEASADDTFNSVVVTAERLDGDVPLRAVERNLNSLSPYRFGGEFGKRVRKLRLQTATTQYEAQRAARSQLTASSALTRQWTMAVVPDYRIEPGDVAAVSYRGIEDTQIIDAVTYPLDTGDTMALSGRSRIEQTLG